MNIILKLLPIFSICISIYVLILSIFNLIRLNRFLKRYRINIPNNFPKIITLCGSTKFKDDFIKVQKELSLKGHIVISVGLFGHSGDNEVWINENKEMLDQLHKRKIDISDAIYVINKNGYIGESTKSEIEYAKKHNKEIFYLEDEK